MSSVHEVQVEESEIITDEHRDHFLRYGKRLWVSEYACEEWAEECLKIFGYEGKLTASLEFGVLYITEL